MAGGSALGYGLPERKTCCILPLISFCILADSNLQLTVFSSLLSFLYPLHILLIYYAFPYPNKEESIRMTDIWDSSSSLARSILKSVFNNIPPAKRFVFHGLVRLSVKKNAGSIWFLHTLPAFSKVRSEYYLLVFSRFHMAGDFFFLLMPVLPVRFLWACGSD